MAATTNAASQAAMTANPNVASQAAALAKAKDRLEQLLDSSYTKIEELRQLLIKESNLQWKDCTHEIEPVMTRQRILHETAVKRLYETMGADDTTSTNRFNGKHFGLVTGRHFHGQFRNSRGLASLPQLPKTSLPHSYSLPAMACLPSYAPWIQPQPALSAREPKFDSIAELRRDESAHLLAKSSTASNRHQEHPLQIKDDRQWYGSLDRNMVKKKKRGPVDKARRHTKIVGSMAALERTDELQPDEQYKIGLPTLARLDPLTNRALSGSRPSPPPVVQRVQATPSPPPPPPPKSNAMSFRAATGKPAAPPMIADLKPIDRSGSSSKEVGASGRGWMETNLDESTFMPLNYTTEVSQGPPSGLGLDTTDSLSRPPLASPAATDISENSSKSSEGKVRIYLNESIKPFVMADYYKYSTKYREAKNYNQLDVGKADLANGNLPASTNDNGNLNTDRSPHLHVPKLPPRDFQMNAKANSKGGAPLQPERTHPPPMAPLDDGDLGWVMDSPTFV